MTYAYFTKYISIYFMFDANTNGIFKISNCGHLWLMYRNIIAIYVLT